MNDAIPCKSIKVDTVQLVKGNYEGYDYYKLVGITNNKIRLSAKLTAFEYNTLLAQERPIK